MDVKRTELLKALKQCLPGIENGNKVLNGADLFVFNNGFVYSYNDVISVSVPVKSEGLLEEGIDGAVRAEEFYGIVNKFNGDLIKFTVENEKWILKSGKAKVELTLMSGDFTERFENIKPDKKKWLEITPEFTQGLGVCRMSNNKNAISGLFITSKEIISSDGFQVNHFKYKGADFENFWISDASAGELLKVGVLTHMQLKSTWAHFKTADNTTFSVKTLNAEKWPYDKIMQLLESHKKTNNAIAATFPKELFDAIDRASSFYLDISDVRAVRLLISPELIVVSSERTAGKFEEKVAWKDEQSEFNSFELYVDTAMILFAARRSLSFYIFEKEGGLPRIIFTTENSIHLMATLSNDDEEKEIKEPAKTEKAEGKKETKKKTEKSADDEDEDSPMWQSKKANAKKKKDDAEEDDYVEPSEEEQAETRVGISGTKKKMSSLPPDEEDDDNEVDLDMGDEEKEEDEDD